MVGSIARCVSNNERPHGHSGCSSSPTNCQHLTRRRSRPPTPATRGDSLGARRCGKATRRHLADATSVKSSAKSPRDGISHSLGAPATMTPVVTVYTRLARLSSPPDTFRQALDDPDEMAAGATISGQAQGKTYAQCTQWASAHWTAVEMTAPTERSDTTSSAFQSTDERPNDITGYLPRTTDVRG